MKIFLAVSYFIGCFLLGFYIGDIIITFQGPTSLSTAIWVYAKAIICLIGIVAIRIWLHEKKSEGLNV